MFNYGGDKIYSMKYLRVITDKQFKVRVPTNDHTRPEPNCQHCSRPRSDKKRTF